MSTFNVKVGELHFATYVEEEAGGPLFVSPVLVTDVRPHDDNSCDVEGCQSACLTVTWLHSRATGRTIATVLKSTWRRGVLEDVCAHCLVGDQNPCRYSAAGRGGHEFAFAEDSRQVLKNILSRRKLKLHGVRGA